MTTELVHPRIEREARWCYERRLERMTVRDMSDLAARPVEQGGLGYPLSPATVSRRVRHYHAAMLELESETRDEARGRELELLDKTTRAAADLVDAVDQAATAKARARAEYLRSIGSDMAPDPRDPGLVVLREDAVRLRALKLLAEVSESRRKLMGLDAPTEHKIDVTVTDAATAELNAMLAEAGLEPIPERETRP